MNNDRKVIIVGAGCTGFALAQGLKKSGIPFEIFERRTSNDTKRDWSFSVHWSVEALRELLPEDLFKRLPEAQVDPHHPGLDSWYQIPILNGETGELIKIPQASKAFRMRSDKMRKWLATGIDVQFGKELADVEYSPDGARVTAKFADGSSSTGSLLVGCDGAHSKVRSLLLGPEHSQSTQVDDFATAMCFSKHTRQHALALRSPPDHPLNQVIVHPKGYIAWLSVHDADDKDHPENWTFFHYISYHTPEDHASFDTQQLLNYQKELAKDFADPIKSVYEWMSPASSSAWFTRIQNWDPSLPEHSWSNHDGRMTLAGDAAHAMSFQRGQGLNNALQDALQLWIAIKNGDGEKARAVEAYEVEMKARGGKEVQLGAENTRLLHDWGRMKESGLMRQGLQNK